jgi:hypothetical protein
LNISLFQIEITHMEGAARVFAGDYSMATLSVAGDDGSPGWVVTPGGAWCRPLYLAGALTEVTGDSDMLHGRLADPTGAFDVMVGGRGAPVAGMIRKIPIPSFVMLSGTAQLYHRNSGVVVSVRPDHLLVVDRGIRDQWVLATAESTLCRLERLLEAIDGRSSDERALTVIRHYGLSRAGLREKAAMVESAIQSVRPPAPVSEERTGVREIIMEILRAESGPRGVPVQHVIDCAAVKGLAQEAVLAAIEELVRDDDCYQPQKGYVKLL